MLLMMQIHRRDAFLSKLCFQTRQKTHLYIYILHPLWGGKKKSGLHSVKLFSKNVCGDLVCFPFINVSRYCVSVCDQFVSWCWILSSYYNADCHFEVSRSSHRKVCGFHQSVFVLWDPAFRPRTVPNTVEQGCLLDTTKKLSQENPTP